MKELRTEITIQASPEKAWQVLTDLDSWAKWNPFIVCAVGKAQPGSKVDITVTGGAKPMILHCTVTKVQQNKELCWTYYVGMPFLFQGEHSFILEPAGDSVRFVDRERFNGMLVPLQAKNIDTKSRSGFISMDEAFKAQVETSFSSD